jgi:hypothetical protein
MRYSNSEQLKNLIEVRMKQKYITTHISLKRQIIRRKKSMNNDSLRISPTEKRFKANKSKEKASQQLDNKLMGLIEYSKQIGKKTTP